MDILELIKKRRSPRGFWDKDISDEDLEKLFEAARWAASSYNSQPWRFIYGKKSKNPEVFDSIFSVLTEFNQAWAKAVPVLILAMATNKYEANGQDYKHSWHDLGLAVANMALTAEDLGFNMHIMGGFDSDKAREIFNIPDNIDPVSVIALGYGGLPGNLPLDIYKMEIAPRIRKEISEFAFDKPFTKAD
jgi:nitroreductase